MSAHTKYRWMVRRLWTALTEPVVSITAFETRLKSRWLATIFVVLVPFGVLVACIPPLVDGRAPGTDPQVVGVLAFTMLLGLSYYLSRQGRYRLSALLAMLTAIVTVFTISLFDNDPDNVINDATYLIAILLFSSSILSQRITALVFVINTLVMLLLPLRSPQIALKEIVKEPLSLMIMMYALIVFGGSLRHALEKYHLDLLKSENAERQRAEAQLRLSLAEKEVLLKEIHHRVKNNLQIMSSLLSLQSPNLHDPVALAQFQDNQSRIRSMALVHERLYRSQDLAHIDFNLYLHDLTNYLLASYQTPAQNITLTVEGEPIFLDIDTAIPSGLLVNELVSNALKHAFPHGRGGEVRVEMRGDIARPYRFVIQDNGVGLPAGMDYRHSTSLGLQLVNQLVHQLGGTVQIQVDQGTTFIITFDHPPKNEAFKESH